MRKNLTKQVNRIVEAEGGIETAVEIKPDMLIQGLKSMYVARQIDNKAMTLLKQGKVFFHIGVSGHEAIQVASAMNFRPGYDWFYPYYRDWAFVYQLGVTLEELFYSVFGRADCPATGGRQMPLILVKRN